MTTQDTQPNDELDKAAQDELMALLALIRSQRWTSDYALGFKKLKEFIIAAKRSKELEKERDTYFNRLGEHATAIFNLEQQLSTLRTAYKQALDALKEAEAVICGELGQDWADQHSKLFELIENEK